MTDRIVPAFPGWKPLTGIDDFIQTGHHTGLARRHGTGIMVQGCAAYGAKGCNPFNRVTSLAADAGHRRQRENFQLAVLASMTTFTGVGRKLTDGI